MNEELKPCPFCGNIPSLARSDKGSDIYCTTDGCYMEPGTVYYCKTEEEMIRLWNTRAK